MILFFQAVPRKGINSTNVFQKFRKECFLEHVFLLIIFFLSEKCAKYDSDVFTVTTCAKNLLRF